MVPVALRVLTAGWMATTLWFGSDAGLDVAAVAGLAVTGVVLGGAWTARAFWPRREYPQRRAAQRRAAGTAAAMVVVAGVLAWPAPSNPFFRARFRVSERALRDRAAALLAAPPTADPSGRVGLFVIRRADVVEGQVRFITTGCRLVDSCGLVYVPSGGSPTRWQEDVFTPLSGGWWHLFEGF